MGSHHAGAPHGNGGVHDPVDSSEFVDARAHEAHVCADDAREDPTDDGLHDGRRRRGSTYGSADAEAGSSAYQPSRLRPPTGVDEKLRKPARKVQHVQPVVIVLGMQWN